MIEVTYLDDFYARNGPFFKKRILSEKLKVHVEKFF